MTMTILEGRRHPRVPEHSINESEGEGLEQQAVESVTIIVTADHGRRSGPEKEMLLFGAKIFCCAHLVLTAFRE
jgi:hypothetical protein